MLAGYLTNERQRLGNQGAGSRRAGSPNVPTKSHFQYPHSLLARSREFLEVPHKLNHEKTPATERLRALIFIKEVCYLRRRRINARPPSPRRAAELGSGTLV